jgi:UDP-N-acetylglucosamine:LPS N-acetylglucosamine transferase
MLEMTALQPWWSRHDVVWAAVRAADTESLLSGCRVSWLSDLSVRRPLAMLPAMVRAWRLMHRERPDLVVSAGSGPAVPFYLIAAATGVPSLWVATLNVLTRPGISARICGRLASRVLVQRPEQIAGHPGAVVVGELY